MINLRSRVDRLLCIRNRLAHPFTVYPAVTPREIAGVDGSRPKRLEAWMDPLLHRPLNDAEVACFLSHYRLWIECAAGALPFVILEDDVETTSDWDEAEVHKHLEPPSHGAGFDLLYLHYREMAEARPATAALVRPTYPYWACAYAITPAGARKLVAAAPLDRGMIPADEFLATMIGYRHEHPNEAVNLAYSGAPRLRAAALRRPMYRVERRTVYGSDIEAPRVPRVLVLTVATEYERARILLESTLANRVPELKVLGVDQEWRSGDPAVVEGGWEKLDFLRTFLAEGKKAGTFDGRDILLFLDGYDTFVHDRIEVIRDRFLDFKCHVLFAAEKVCWPRRNQEADWPETHTEYRYLNSGAYMGYVGAIEELVRSWSPSRDLDDQQFYIDRYLEVGRGATDLDLRLDHECAIFQCLNRVLPGELVTTASGGLFNTSTRTRPCVVHGNGPVKSAFVRLANELGYDGSIADTLARARRRAAADRAAAACADSEPQITYIDNPLGEFRVIGPEMLLVDFMTPEACTDLIRFAEERAGWKPLDGDRFPAQEIRLRDLSPRLFHELEQFWQTHIAPLAENHWQPLCMYGIRDAFLIKYTADSQRSLALHNDASLVTGCVRLNEGYEGGVLVWPRQKVTNAKVAVGKLILFPGQVTHGHRAEDVTSGSKYTLTIWTSRFRGDVNY